MYRKSKHANLVFIALLSIGFFFIIARLTYPVKLIQKFVYYVAYLNIEAASDILSSTDRFSDNIKAIVLMRQENLKYKQENQKLIEKLSYHDIISKEYDDLSKLLKLTKIEQSNSVFARVSARESREWYQWLIIDKGETDGLYNDLPVVMLKGDNEFCAVGRIIETFRTSSKVALITNAVYALPIEIKGKGIGCLAEGFNSRLLKVTYIPSDAHILPGDEIIVSGLSEVFQRGIPVGVITRVSDESTIDFQTAFAEVFFELSNINEVIVLVPRQ